YFFNKAAADPNCGIDTKLSFIKPEVMSNDIIIDYINGTNPILGGEGEDMGTGTSEDYEIPKNIKPEDLGAESDIIIENKKPATPPSVPGNNTNKPTEKPKAVLPPPIKKPGGNK
ncbi:MAG: hypothetical protein ACK41Z_11305, partial [Sediminibacterium sp.]